MKILKGILFAVIYTIGYVFLAMLMTGGGHGNWIVMVPVHISWLLNFAALILLALPDYKITRYFFVSVLTIYYVLLFITLREAYVESLTDKKIITQFTAVLIPAFWFISGQLIIWAVFFKKIKETKRFD